MATHYIVVDSCRNKDSFYSKWSLSESTVMPTQVDDIDGVTGGAIALDSNDQYRIDSATLPIPMVSGTTWVVWSFWVKIVYVGNNASSPLVVHTENTGAIAVNPTYTDAWLKYDASQGLQVRWGATNETNLGVNLEYDTWYHIEYAHRFGNATTGNWVVYVNGNEVGSGVGDNDGEAWTYLYLTGVGSSTTTYAVYDDIVMAVSDDAVAPRLGMLKVAHLVPTGTAQGQWTGSDADSVDNHLLVDDDDAASADYVEATAGSGLVDLYSHDGLPAGATPVAVQVAAAANLDALGTDDFGIVIDSNGSQDVTSRVLGAGSPTWKVGNALDLDPDGNVAWTKAKVDAMTFGVTS